MAFSRIAIVGIGLIGGSFAAGSRRLDPRPEVFGVDIDPETLKFALETGIVDKAAAPDDAFEQGWFGPDGVDLVVLATPASIIEEWCIRLGDAGFSGVVTDVASTKKGVLEAAARHLGSAATFVGGHPMAGSEQSGVRAARKDLFDGAYYVLTPTSDTDMHAYRKLHAFVAALGARVISVDAHVHDEAVAAVSHVPHVAAAALVELACARSGDGGELLRLAAGGFKDTTRIAAGSSDLWTGICLDNADALAEGLSDLADMLDTFAALIQARDADAIREWLAHAAEIRRSLPAQWVPDTEQLTELLIPITDRPGVISEVTNAVGRAGCNIEAIEIDHQSEDSAVLVLVLTDEGDLERLVSDLAAVGYDPRVQPLESEA